MGVRPRAWRRRDVLAGLGGLGTAALLPACWSSDAADDRPLDIVSSEDSFDVCVAGTGPAGAFLAEDLERRGLRVALLESGGATPLGPDAVRSVGAIDYPIAATRLRAPGGTSGIWTGRCTRLHPIDFAQNAYTPEGAAWPLSYAEIEPYYELAEQSLGVRCESTSRFAPPRRKPFPEASGNSLPGLKRLGEVAGIAVDDTPTSFGPAGERTLRVGRDVLPALTASPRIRFFVDTTLTQLEIDGRGAVQAAIVRGRDGSRGRVRAACFVLATGAVENARLLLLSRTADFPNGIGNRFDQVGRGFNEHPTFHYYGRIPHDRYTLSPPYELGRCHQFYESMKRAGFGSLLLGVIQSWVFPDGVRAAKEGDVATLLGRLARRIRRAELLFDVQMEIESTAANRVALDTDNRDVFGSPGARLSFRFSERDRRCRAEADRIVRGLFAKLGAQDIREQGLTWGHHHIGTCRAGADPRRSVVDEDLKVHGASNLYVAGSAVFPTGGAAHPTLTIVALSYRLAEHLSARLAAAAPARSGAGPTTLKRA